MGEAAHIPKWAMDLSRLVGMRHPPCRVMRSLRNRCCRRVRPENSARAFHSPAPILRMERVRRIFQMLAGREVLEVGGGCLRNALYLQQQGFRVSVLEVPGMRDRFPSQYETFSRQQGRLYKELPSGIKFTFVLATFVIETICDRDVRARLLRAIGRALRPKGCFVMSVRGPRDLLTAQNQGVPCSDGYMTPNLTFARSYTRTQAQRFLKSCGFKRGWRIHAAV